METVLDYSDLSVEDLLAEAYACVDLIGQAQAKISAIAQSIDQSAAEVLDLLAEEQEMLAQL